MFWLLLHSVFAREGRRFGPNHTLLRKNRFSGILIIKWLVFLCSVEVAKKRQKEPFFALFLHRLRIKENFGS